MQTTMNAFTQNFWVMHRIGMKTIIGFLLINPLLLLSPARTSPGGCWYSSLSSPSQWHRCCHSNQRLLALEGIVMGMTTPQTVYHEVVAAFPVILLLVFLVAGIYL